MFPRRPAPSVEEQNDVKLRHAEHCVEEHEALKYSRAMHATLHRSPPAPLPTEAKPQASSSNSRF